MHATNKTKKLVSDDTMRPKSIDPLLYMDVHYPSYSQDVVDVNVAHVKCLSPSSLRPSYSQNVVDAAPRDDVVDADVARVALVAGPTLTIHPPPPSPLRPSYSQDVIDADVAHVALVVGLTPGAEGAAASVGAVEERLRALGVRRQHVHVQDPRRPAADEHHRLPLELPHFQRFQVRALGRCGGKGEGGVCWLVGGGGGGRGAG